jgi:hypothetical protein
LDGSETFVSQQLGPQQWSEPQASEWKLIAIDGQPPLATFEYAGMVWRLDDAGKLHLLAMTEQAAYNAHLHNLPAGYVATEHLLWDEASGGWAVPPQSQPDELESVETSDEESEDDLTFNDPGSEDEHDEATQGNLERPDLLKTGIPYEPTTVEPDDDDNGVVHESDDSPTLPADDADDVPDDGSDDGL